MTELADAVVAVDPAGRSALWAYRERHTEAISTVGIPHKMDVAVPLARMAAFRAELDPAVCGGRGGRDGAAPGCSCSATSAPATCT